MIMETCKKINQALKGGDDMLGKAVNWIKGKLFGKKEEAVEPVMQRSWEEREQTRNRMVKNVNRDEMYWAIRAREIRAEFEPAIKAEKALRNRQEEIALWKENNARLEEMYYKMDRSHLYGKKATA